MGDKFALIGCESRLGGPGIERPGRIGEIQTVSCGSEGLRPRIDNVGIPSQALSLSGEVAWSSAGADIFSEGFELHPDYIEAIDFNRAVYRMDIATGYSMK